MTRNETTQGESLIHFTFKESNAFYNTSEHRGDTATDPHTGSQYKVLYDNES